MALEQQPPNPLLRFGSKRPIVLDGGLGTELETTFAKDLSGNLWSARLLLEDPESIRAVHGFYLEVGADIITTSTYQATTQGFQGALNLSPTDSALLMRTSVTLAQEAIATALKQHPRSITPVIAISLGCFGATLGDGSEYTGTYPSYADQAYLARFHIERAHAILSPSSSSSPHPLLPPPPPEATLLLFETIPCILEARAIADAVQSSPLLQRYTCAVSFSCSTETTTRCGALLTDCIATLPPRYFQIVGINCTDPILVTHLLRAATSITKKQNQLACVYPNSGETYNPVTKTWAGFERGPTAIEAWRTWSKAWVHAGADVVGGCCRTGPAHVRVVKELAEQSV
ncbi:Homocysteine S-methyltransferase ybgG [Powellomyces hirtus]|nr:Homocysteine S-methyltransferase ybgG [Powellomyces hirtus]